MREMSVTEQRYKAVLGIIADGRTVTQVARDWDVARQPAPSKSAVYRSLLRAGLIDPLQRQRRRESWKRWERVAPMELWQLDLVHGFLLADGISAKALTGVDDHSMFCISAHQRLTS